MIKKVVIVCSEFPPHTGGIGNHAYNVSRYLQKEGIEVTVIAPDNEGIGDLNEFDRLQPFTIYRTSGRIRKLFTIISRLKQEATSGSVVLVSGQTMLVIAGIASFVLRKNIRIAAMAHALDINSSNSIIRGLVNFALTRFTKIIAVSSYTASKLKPEFFRKTVVINNGFDGSAFKAGERTLRPSPIKNPKMITVGSVSYRKGQLNVIRSLPELKKKFPHVHYDMVGLPVIADVVRQEAKKLDVLENISIHGVADDARVKTLLAGSDIFVMLSDKTPDGDYEGFGIAIIEANAMGLPAIGSGDCGIEDAIRPGYSGILVDPHNVMETSAAVDAILENYNGYRTNAMAHAKQFHWSEVIQKYILELNQLTAS